MEDWKKQEMEAFKNGELFHYGTPRHSGRYPWGSGEDPFQRNHDKFYQHVTQLRKRGIADKDIAAGMNMKLTDLRARMSIAKSEVRKEQVAQAMKLKEKGYSNTAIAERMGLGKSGESQVRNLLDKGMDERFNRAEQLSNQLKEAVEKNKYIDISKGVGVNLGVSETKLNEAVVRLVDQGGYNVHNIYVRQMGTGERTTIKVLTTDDVDYKTAYANRDKLRLPFNNVYFEDGGSVVHKVKTPISIDSKRIEVRYANDEVSGSDRDGLIELRRGVKDLDMGGNLYSQVRIAVDGKSYIKGMALYVDDLPDGVDIRVNSNKKRGTPLHDEEGNGRSVFKPLKPDPDTNNPFGATISRQITDENDNLTSAINLVNEEGSWGDWHKSLSSQVLSKQPIGLIKSQLKESIDITEEKFDEIKQLTNRAVKKKALADFAEECETAAVELKAAALPRQSSQVLLPMPFLKENEICAPNYRDGERVVLIRHPHAGTFEIPELIVNNKNQEALRLLKKEDGSYSRDAVGIHPKAAEQLSGADFDGDSVLVIPNNEKKIKTRPMLEGLKGFDPKVEYATDGSKLTMNDRQKGLEMGRVSNLITDMTLIGTSDDKLERAVKASMVIIDAQKHRLDWKKAYKDLNIQELINEYQNNGDGKHGAGTLISRAGSEIKVPARRKIINADGSVEYIEKGTMRTKFKFDDNGNMVSKELVPVTTSSEKMREVKNAYDLLSGPNHEGTAQERVYADYANRMKALAMEARKESMATPNLEYNPSSYAVYKQEAESLKTKLKAAQAQSPLERQAQVIAGKMWSDKCKANPQIMADKKKAQKERDRCTDEARYRVGKKKYKIEITDREWEAIQAGAIHHTTLMEILTRADADDMRRRSMPRQNRTMSAARVARVKSMVAQGRTTAQIADALGVSTSTIQMVIDGEG